MSSSQTATTDERRSSSQIGTDIEDREKHQHQHQHQASTITPETCKRKRSTSDLQDAKSNSNSKSPPSLRISLSFDGEALVRKEDEMTPSPPKGRSALRISMSSDGEAVIRADNEPSPSKNRLVRTRRPVARGSLRRSHSAMLPVTARVPDRLFGRSRDPRIWESTVDTDARSALSNSTSTDGTSPGLSLGLHRSRSQRSLSSRQNILANQSPGAGAGAGPVHDKRRKLSRTVSSLGRLESNNRNPAKTVSMAKSKLGEDGDENKENWIPGTRMSNVARRRTTVSHHARPVLADSNQKRSRPPLHKHASVPASQNEDLDCIQGLLSLSQGAWR